MKPPPPDGGFLLPRVATAMRERAAVSRAEIARRLGVAPSAVTQFEAPSNPTTEPTVRAYADALGVPFEGAVFDALAELRAQGPT